MTPNRTIILLFFLLAIFYSSYSQDTMIYSRKIDSLYSQIIKLEKEKQLLLLENKEQQQNRNIRTVLAVTFIVAVFIGFLVFFRRVIDNRKKLNNQLEEKVKERTVYLEKVINKLGKTNDELDTFLYRASHDLKGPLVTMEGLCNIARIENETPSVDEFLKMQLEILDRMKLLLFRIIEIGQIRGHQINPSAILLPKYCRRMVRSMSRVDGYKDFKFTIDMPDNLTIEADIEMLEIALDNIIRNAIEHNQSHFSERYVKISCVEDEKKWEIRIADNGFGIPEKVAEKVFNLFFRNTEKTKGFGLGLYKARIAIEKLNGELRLAHSDDNETVFGISLPKNPKNGKFNY